MNDVTSYVWVFNGERGSFPSGIFSDQTRAEIWIAKHRLTGVLTIYPVDMGAYEWAIGTGAFKPTREDQRTAAFIGRFTCGKEHWHYENGRRLSESLEEAKEP